MKIKINLMKKGTSKIDKSIKKKQVLKFGKKR